MYPYIYVFYARMMFGSVHTNMALELVYWLQRVKFDGRVYFDTFPRNEDPVCVCVCVCVCVWMCFCTWILSLGMRIRYVCVCVCVYIYI